MLALGVVLNTVGIGLFCGLIFLMATHALPIFVAVNFGLAAWQSGAGFLGTPLVGSAAAAVTQAIGWAAFASLRSPLLRAAIAAIFVVLAGIAGYHTFIAVADFGAPSSPWREFLAGLGALVIGATAWARLVVLAEFPAQITAVPRRGGRDADVPARPGASFPRASRRSVAYRRD